MPKVNQTCCFPTALTAQKNKGTQRISKSKNYCPNGITISLPRGVRETVLQYPPPQMRYAHPKQKQRVQMQIKYSILILEVTCNRRLIVL